MDVMYMCSAPEATAAECVAALRDALNRAVPRGGRVVHVSVHANALLPRRLPRSRPVLLRGH